MELLNFLKEIPIIAVEIIRGIFVIIGELIVARINSKNKQAKREAEAAGGNNHSTKDDHSMHGGKGNQLTDNSRKIDKSTHNHYHGPVTIQNPPQPQKIDPKRPTKSYNLGKSFEEQRDYSRAIEYFETALVEQEEATGPMSEDLARVHNALGINYYRAGATRCNDAITQFNNALAIYRANGKMETNLDAAMTKNNIGAVYQSQGKYDSALKLH
ncbi:MAG: tetratricopeptide repeat protein, partial [Christensenellaceae bacterium]|nr:tetratricopeptide repeat protein [Christensenellaceae bacterium]